MTIVCKFLQKFKNFQKNTHEFWSLFFSKQDESLQISRTWHRQCRLQSVNKNTAGPRQNSAFAILFTMGIRAESVARALPHPQLSSAAPQKKKKRKRPEEGTPPRRKRERRRARARVFGCPELAVVSASNRLFVVAFGSNARRFMIQNNECSRRLISASPSVLPISPKRIVKSALIQWSTLGATPRGLTGDKREIKRENESPRIAREARSLLAAECFWDAKSGNDIHLLE